MIAVKISFNVLISCQNKSIWSELAQARKPEANIIKPGLVKKSLFCYMVTLSAPQSHYCDYWPDRQSRINATEK